MMNLFSLDNPVFRSYIFYSSILSLKVLLMALLTSAQRAKKVASSNDEDIKMNSGKIKKVNDDIERVRRAHLNDLENIPLFLLAAGAFVLTNPVPSFAINLFRAFTAARIAHTLFYGEVDVFQPARSISFSVGFFITIYMLYQNILYVS